MSRSVLMVAYHFPPLVGSSGIQRTLRFVQQLPQFGWRPLVLTCTPRAYERCSDDLLCEVPEGTVVRRAWARDTARDFSLSGRYLAWMARPDRWASWRFDAVRQGLRMVREFQPQAIWSTYPIATAHVVGAVLAKKTGLPWIADFRDPMAQDGYPADPITHRQFIAIEQRAMASAALNLFTTPSAAHMYAQRYPEAASRVAVLENGYDEESFCSALAAGGASPLNPGCLTLLHSGIVYPSERDPNALFAALAQLKAIGQIGATSDGTRIALRLRLRAAVHEDLMRELAQAHGIVDLVEVLPAIGYRDALEEMLRADALVVMQGANCNEQIPAKVYEYLRAGRPLLGLCEGDTAAVLRRAGVYTTVSLHDAQAISECLCQFLPALAQRTAPMPTGESVRAASRLERCRELAAHLQRITA